MLTIRLRRTGAKKDPHFRVVVVDSRTSRDGPFIEVLGHYHPRRDPAEFTIDRDATDAWVAKGAQLSDTVRTLIRQLDAGKVKEPEGPRRPAAAEKPAEADAGAEEEEETPAEKKKAAPEVSEKAGQAEEAEEEADEGEEAEAAEDEEEKEKKEGKAAADEGE